MKRLALALSFVALTLTGCPKLAPLVPPVANFGQCVAADAVAGKTLIAIVNDCGGDLISVVAAILQSTDAGVQSSPAHGEAGKLALMASEAKQ